MDQHTTRSHHSKGHPKSSNEQATGQDHITQTLHHNASSQDNFTQTMEQVRKELRRSTRPFSRLIHVYWIERCSELFSKTIARPNALLAGGIAAFLGTLTVYSYAKYTGFALQGSETIVAFIIGWLLGLAYDLVRAVIRSKQ